MHCLKSGLIYNEYERSFYVYFIKCKIQSSPNCIWHFKLLQVCTMLYRLFVAIFTLWTEISTKSQKNKCHAWKVHDKCWLIRAKLTVCIRSINFYIAFTHTHTYTRLSGFNKNALGLIRIITHKMSMLCVFCSCDLTAFFSVWSVYL